MEDTYEYRAPGIESKNPRHVAGDIPARLEELFKVNSVEEIETKSKQALFFFREIAAELSTN